MKETRELRSRIMRAVKSGDTKPELLVRSLVHRIGYRFRVRRRDLPGKPDLVFPGLHKAIFVHGCFWHGHDCVRGARVPKANREYWRRKVARNRERDLDHLEELAAAGWKSLVIWECDLQQESRLSDRIKRFLGASGLNRG